MKKLLTILWIAVSAIAAYGQPFTTPPLYIAIAAPGCSGATCVAITSPANGSTISGTAVNFTAATGANVASVDWRIGNFRLAPVTTTPPFSLTWNSGRFSDGVVYVEAIARDAFGNVLGTSTNNYQINNFGNSFAISSPTLDGTLSGTLNLAVSTPTNTVSPPNWYMAGIDGIQYVVNGYWPPSSIPPANRQVTIDTTTMLNGPHELYVQSVYENATSSLADWAIYQRMINVNNGHTVMTVFPSAAALYIQPSGTATITCSRLYTDNVTGACTSPAYSTSDSTCATVSSGGVITAASSEGFCTITVTDASGRSGTTWVTVRTATGIPNIGGSGVMRTTQASDSIFSFSPFGATISVVMNEPGNSFGGTGLQEMNRAGVNTLEDEFYQPGALNDPTGFAQTYSSWQTAYDAFYISYWNWAVTNGFHIRGLGDTLARYPGEEGFWVPNWPQSAQAVAHAMEVLANTGVSVGIEMIDEGSTFWGQYTQPSGFVGQPIPQGEGSTSYFQSVTCSGTTCTVTWPGNAISNGLAGPGFGFNNGQQFALAGSSNSNLNTPYGAAAVFTGNINGTTLTVASIIKGTIQVGQTLYADNVTPGTVITGGSGTSWTVNNSQTSLNPMGFQAAPNSNPALFTVANITATTFQFTPLGTVNGTFNASTDPGLQFLHWGTVTCNRSNNLICNPPLQNNTLLTISNYLNSASPKVPITWPAEGFAPVETQDNWVGKHSLSDYAEHYWDSLQFRNQYSWGRGISENAIQMRNQFIQRQPVVKLDAAQIFLCQCGGGGQFIKEAMADGYYVPLVDTPQLPGVPQAGPVAQMMTTVALGGSGIRAYTWEDSSIVAAKYSAPVGTTIATGASPYSSDPGATSAWHQEGFVSNLMAKALQNYIFSTTLPSPHTGLTMVAGISSQTPATGNNMGGSPLLTSAARQGSDADLVLFVNAVDNATPITVNLAPYVVGGTPQTVRYVLNWNGIQTTLLAANAMSDSITLDAGSSVAYLVPTQASWTNKPTQAVSLTPPNVGQTSTAVRYSYIYSGELASQVYAVNCTGGCTLNLDRRLGDVYYQYTYVNAAGDVTGYSAVTDLPPLSSN